MPLPSKYPWASWFAKGKVTLLYRKDFHCKIPVMVQQIRNAGNRHGYAIAVRTTATSVSFKATKDEGEEE